MTLAELIEKVEGLTGPDREVDAAIAIHFGEPHGYFEEVHLESRSYTVIEERAKRYTASLDAAVALCERVLPMMWRSIEWAGTSKQPPSEWPVVEFGIGDFEGRVQAKTAPIALVLATLRAIRTLGGSDAG